MERAGLRRLLDETGCAVAQGGGVFLCDPKWTPAERAAAEVVMGQVAAYSGEGRGWLAVRTGGSGGGVKFARHDEATLLAAVGGFCRHFELDRVDAVGVLPASHVSGLMTLVRSAVTGGRHVAWHWKRLEAGDVPALGAGDRWVISLVPTQLQRLLGRPETVAWLRELRLILLGGGPVWPRLAEEAAAAGLRIALTYGMTETAAMIAAATPEEFQAGCRDCGRSLPHGRLTLSPEGLVTVGGPSLFRGYWPEERAAPDWVTEDLGELDAAGRLRVLGRRDALIISGGRKIVPDEVEAALRASGEFADVVVLGLPDEEWGERVVACYPASGPRPDLARAVAGLGPVQRPKRFVAVAEWPRNPQGKISRPALRAAVLALGAAADES
jgi:O-succinylbenzoic acid--CoA ligase